MGPLNFGPKMIKDRRPNCGHFNIFTTTSERREREKESCKLGNYNGGQMSSNFVGCFFCVTILERVNCACDFLKACWKRPLNKNWILTLIFSPRLHQGAKDFYAFTFFYRWKMTATWARASETRTRGRGRHCPPLPMRSSAPSPAGCPCSAPRPSTR